MRLGFCNRLKAFLKLSIRITVYDLFPEVQNGREHVFLADVLPPVLDGRSHGLDRYACRCVDSIEIGDVEPCCMHSLS